MTPIFLHGLGQRADSWERVRACWGKDAACPDLYSLFEQREVSYRSLYRGLERYCEEKEPPLVFCGLSLGAVLALQYALDHPRQVGGLALIAPQYRMPKALLSLQNLLFRLMPDGAFQETGLTKKNMIRLTGSMKEIDLSPRLGNLRCPVLILCGEKDKANRQAARSLAAALPGASLREIAGAGHEVNRDAPEELAKRWVEFVSSLPEKENGL